jgi:hypothetical protein
MLPVEPVGTARAGRSDAPGPRPEARSLARASGAPAAESAGSRAVGYCLHLRRGCHGPDAIRRMPRADRRNKKGAEAPFLVHV